MIGAQNGSNPQLQPIKKHSKYECFSSVRKHAKI